jgi:hypothetical protein
MRLSALQPFSGLPLLIQVAATGESSRTPSTPIDGHKDAACSSPDFYGLRVVADSNV